MRNAVGIVRVSRTKGEGIVSPSEQRERIEAACEREGMALVIVLEEMDVSGGAALAKRSKLSRAIAMIESGEADVLVVSYLDRLVRSIRVQSEIVQRVEDAGGAVWTVDMGEITNGSPTKKLQANLMGSVAEYLRETTAERTQEAKRRAIERGVPTFDRIPAGYRQREDRTLEPDPVEAPIMREAFAMRADGATIEECRRYLREHGIEVSYSALTGMFRNRIYLGELRFGDLYNPSSHAAIIDPATFQRVQQVSLPRGRKPKSERLLARLGVLRCGTCGARMVVGQARANGRTYPMYRCPPNGDCPQRVTISATIAEQRVVDAVQELLADVHGRASLDDGVAEAERDLARHEAELDAAVRAFAGIDDVDATRERLLELREARETARNRVEELRAATAPSVTVAAGDWDLLTLDEQRALIRAVIESATVTPGRGHNRITIHPFGE